MAFTVRRPMTAVSATARLRACRSRIRESGAESGSPPPLVAFVDSTPWATASVRSWVTALANDTHMAP